LFLGPFVEKYPGIEIIIDEITTKEILKALHRDLIDVGVLALPVNIPDFIEQTLYYEPFVAYISKKHPLFRKDKINIDDLSRDDLLLLKEGHCLRGHALKLCRTTEKQWRENERKILFESGSIDTLKKLVELNFGVTLLPYMAVKDIQNEEQLSLVREFNQPVPKREIGLVYNKTLLKKHFIDALYDEIQKVIPKTLLENENSLIVK